MLLFAPFNVVVLRRRCFVVCGLFTFTEPLLEHESNNTASPKPGKMLGKVTKH